LGAKSSAACPQRLRVWLYSSGQACTSGSRLLVPAGRVAEAGQLIVEKVGAFSPRLPDDPAARVGPMVTQAHYDGCSPTSGTIRADNTGGGVPRSLVERPATDQKLW
jgi:acyl-CoA reductase-like NAD-dependent aldehyde dehydrogenase